MYETVVQPGAQNNNTLHVRFFIPETPFEQDMDANATREQGRPIYRSRTYCEISMPANKYSKVVCPAEEKRYRDKATNAWFSAAEMFPEQYRRFKAGQAEQNIGTPLTELPALTAAKRAELKAISITTVEMLASLEGQTLKVLGMEGPGLKNLAKSYLDRAQGMAADARTGSEMAAMKAMIEDLQAQLAMVRDAKPSTKTDDANDGPAKPPGEFDGWSPDDLKAFIKARVGQAPRGNPSIETLTRMAEKALADEMADPVPETEAA